MEVKVIKFTIMYAFFNVCSNLHNDLFVLLSSLDGELKSAPQGKYTVDYPFKRPPQSVARALNR